MHLIEKYATSTGLLIDKPFIYEKFINIPDNKFIIFSPHSKPAKTPDFWQDVIDILLPILQKQNISIVQIGDKNERVYGGVINYTGKTNVNQVAYLINRSELVLGVDTFSIHIAGHYDKKIVSLYSNNNINNVKPFWGNKNNQILLEPFRKTGERPSYSLEENPKSINTIKPEEVVKSVIKLLNIDFTYNFSTIFTGNRYYNRLIELVPDSIINTGEIGINSLIIRMDYFFNEEILARQMEICPVTIITNKPINPNLLMHYKPRVMQIIYSLDDDNSLDFVKFLHENGFNYALISKKNKETIQKYKLKYMEYGLILEEPHGRPQILQNYKSNKIFYKTGKFTLSRNKIYHSKNDWILGKESRSLIPTPLPIMDTSIFWEDSDHFSLLLQN